MVVQRRDGPRRLRDHDDDDDDVGYRYHYCSELLYEYDFVDVCMSDYFQLMSADGDRTVTRGNPFKLSVNYCRTNTRKTFSEHVVKVSNSSPPSIANFSSLATFRNS